ncbi:MAG: hypothetical protein JO053_05590 [Acidobacteria bacterium]|nr:hypothetical protein [Acidobacteriota bacterium]
MFRRSFSLAVCLLITLTVPAFAQVQKIVDAEHAFAARAAEVGNPQAFLEYMMDDAWSFNPAAVKAKPFWESRKRNDALLSWAPNFADAAGDGSFGYTSGNWEWRAKGKDDQPSAFGDFNTIWIRQPDGRYKWLIDIGVGHDRPAQYSTEWATTKFKPTTKKHVPPAQSSMDEFDRLASSKGAAAAWAAFSSEQIRLFREDKLPFLGKSAAAAAFPANVFVSFSGPLENHRSNDMGFYLRRYTMSENGRTIETGNQLQVWKLEAGKWHIVLDVLKAVPLT